MRKRWTEGEREIMVCVKINKPDCPYRMPGDSGLCKTEICQVTFDEILDALNKLVEFWTPQIDPMFHQNVDVDGAVMFASNPVIEPEKAEKTEPPPDPPKQKPKRKYKRRK